MIRAKFFGYDCVSEVEHVLWGIDVGPEWLIVHSGWHAPTRRSETQILCRLLLLSIRRDVILNWPVPVFCYRARSPVSVFLSILIWVSVLCLCLCWCSCFFFLLRLPVILLLVLVFRRRVLHHSPMVRTFFAASGSGCWLCVCVSPPIGRSFVVVVRRVTFAENVEVVEIGASSPSSCLFLLFCVSRENLELIVSECSLHCHET